MAPTHDLEHRPVVDHRSHVPLARRHLGQRREHVQVGTAPGDPLQPRDIGADARPERLEQLPLERLHPFGRVQHLLLELLERRCDVPFGAGKRLPPLEVRGHEVAIRVRDLDVIAEHTVVADLQGGDSRADALGRLQRRDRILPSGRDRPQVVERGIHARRDRLPIPVRQRRTRHECALDLGRELRRIVPRGGESGERAATVGASERCDHLWEPRQRIPQRPHVTRGRAAGGGATRKALDVAHPVECLAKCRARERVRVERCYGVESREDRRQLREWCEDPLAQQSRPHRRLRAIEHADQRAARVVAGAERLDQLEVPARHLVERHRAAGTFDARAREVRQSARLQLAQVAQQRTARAHRDRICRADPEPLEGLHREVRRQRVVRQRRLELPSLARRDQRAGRRRQ